MKREAAFNTVFNQWLKNVHKQTGVYELKVAKGNSIPFDAVVEHQIQSLEASNHGLLVWKIPDCGYQNPFDCFSMYKVPAWVVIKFANSFEMITIDTFVLEKSRSKRKSLTSERAREISTISVKL